MTSDVYIDESRDTVSMATTVNEKGS